MSKNDKEEVDLNTRANGYISKGSLEAVKDFLKRKAGIPQTARDVALGAYEKALIWPEEMGMPKADMLSWANRHLQYLNRKVDRCVMRAGNTYRLA